jgi:hypothetical protein
MNTVPVSIWLVGAGVFTNALLLSAEVRWRPDQTMKTVGSIYKTLVVPNVWVLLLYETYVSDALTVVPYVKRRRSVCLCVCACRTWSVREQRVAIHRPRQKTSHCFPTLIQPRSLLVTNIIDWGVWWLWLGLTRLGTGLIDACDLVRATWVYSDRSKMKHPRNFRHFTRVQRPAVLRQSWGGGGLIFLESTANRRTKALWDFGG